MAKGKGSSGGHGHNPSKPKKQPQKKPDKKKTDNKPKKPDNKPPKKPDQKKHGGGSGPKIDIGEVIKDIGIILGQLGDKKPGGAEPKTPEPSGGTEPKPDKTSQADLQKYIDLLDKEVASANPDKELMAGLIRKIKAALASSGGNAGALNTRLDDVLKKLESPK
jgi:hypothetical protein